MGVSRNQMPGVRKIKTFICNIKGHSLCEIRGEPCIYDPQPGEIHEGHDKSHCRFCGELYETLLSGGQNNE